SDSAADNAFPQTPPSEPDVEPPQTPAGMLSALGGSMTPGLGALTPGTLLQAGLTPALQHPAMTPGGLQHGGMTPVGLHHGDSQHVDLGLSAGGMTPAGLHHGGMTPGLLESGMTPAGLVHGGLTPAGLHHGGMTPGVQHGAMLQHGMEQLPMMPQLGGEQVSSLLRSSLPGAALPPAAHELPHTLPMEPLLHGLDDHGDYQNGMQMTNFGYDDQHGHNSPQHDYDLPLTPDNADEGEREAGETDEQFEERVLNRRAAQLFAVMKPKLSAGLQLSFTDLAPRHNNRKQVAQKFYSLLVLKKHQVLKLEQHETYGPITISKGNQFETEAI
ncbi:hypothetical protein B5X24_HaOG212986, partial [Helicoverpa armigera]